MKTKQRPLDGIEQWMVQRNLEYVATKGLTAVVENLRRQGYMRVAAAVEKSSTKS